MAQQQQQYPGTAIPTIQTTLQVHQQQQQQQPYSQHHHHPYEYISQPHPSYQQHHQQQPPYTQQHQQQLPITFPYAQPYHHHQYGAVSVPGIGQYPVPPPPSAAAYTHHHHYSERPTSKRPRETAAADASEGPSTKRQALGNDVLFRVVVPSSQIGKVIGKGGHRVQKVREDTKATVKIADPIARYEERVIIISSKANDGALTDAEKALLQIASLILADDGSSAQTLSVGAAPAPADPYGGAGAVVGLGSVGPTAVHMPANSVRLLIAGSQAGGLIGVSGQNIEKLRESSGASITVLAPNQLPLCASAHESDRLVQISGEVPAVLKALEEIGVELRANPPNQVISISPTYNLSIARAAQSYMDPNAAEYLTLDMVISETMVGGLIGRSGSNIARIRTESGAMIKVFGGKGEQKHRQIQLIGTAEQVALAKQRVDEYIYTQLTQ